MCGLRHGALLGKSGIQPNNPYSFKNLHFTKPSFSSLMLQLNILGNKMQSCLRTICTSIVLGRSSAGDFGLGQRHPRKPGNYCLRLGASIKFWWEESVHVGTKPHVPEKHLPLGQIFEKEPVQSAEIEASTCLEPNSVYREKSLIHEQR